MRCEDSGSRRQHGDGGGRGDFGLPLVFGMEDGAELLGQHKEEPLPQLPENHKGQP